MQIDILFMAAIIRYSPRHNNFKMKVKYVQKVLIISIVGIRFIMYGISQ